MKWKKLSVRFLKITKRRHRPKRKRSCYIFKIYLGCLAATPNCLWINNIEPPSRYWVGGFFCVCNLRKERKWFWVILFCEPCLIWDALIPGISWNTIWIMWWMEKCVRRTEEFISSRKDRRGSVSPNPTDQAAFNPRCLKTIKTPKNLMISTNPIPKQPPKQSLSVYRERTSLA